MRLNNAYRASEDQIQKSFMRWLDLCAPEGLVSYSIPNERNATPWQVERFKAMGLRPGFPDMGFVWRGRAYFIEFKSISGRVRPNQRQMRDAIIAAGGEVVVCRSLDEAIDALRGWAIPVREKAR